MFQTIRLRLLSLVLIVAIPLIAATFFVIERLADAQLKAQEQTLISSTRAISAAVEAEIKKYAFVGYALGTSVPLQAGDFAQFAQQVRSATAHLPGTWVVVANVEGQQLVNTLRPFGEPLPFVAPLDIHYLAFQTRMFQVGDIVIGPAAKRPTLGVFVPVFKNDQPQYDIVIGLDPHVFTRILDDQKLPPGWVTGIGDRKGHFVARSIDNDRFLAAPISEGWRAASLQGQEGYFDNISKEGVPLHSAFKNLPGSEWTVSVGASRAILNQSVRDSLWLVVLSSIILIGLSMALAWMAARSIIRSMKSLEVASLSLLQNQFIDVSKTGLREVDDAVVAFESAGKSILEREELHTLLVKELNHRVKNLFAIMGGIVSLSAKSAATPQELTKAIRGRLDALARAHELVLPKMLRTQGAQRQTTSIEELMRSILSPYADGDDSDANRVTFSGPSVAISDKAATSLALVVHELATNAAKYGALSNSVGRIEVSWSLADEQLHIGWLEHDGPKVSATPNTDGFGSILADRSIRGQLGGELVREWLPDGLKVTINLPLERIGV